MDVQLGIAVSSGVRHVSTRQLPLLRRTVKLECIHKQLLGTTRVSLAKGKQSRNGTSLVQPRSQRFGRVIRNTPVSCAASEVLLKAQAQLSAGQDRRQVFLQVAALQLARQRKQRRRLLGRRL
jgi:hypothetical protein